MCRYCYRHVRHLVTDTTQQGNVEVKTLDQGEKGLFSKIRRVKKDKMCTANYPLMMAIDTTQLKTTCYYCLDQQDNFAKLPCSQKNQDEERSNGGWTTCRDCKVVTFCNAHCQIRANDNFHKLECPIYQALQPRILPNHIRAVLRVLLLRKTSRWRDETWTKLKNMPSQVDKFRSAGGKRWEELVTMTQCAMEYSETNEPFDLVISLFCALLIRGVPLGNDLCMPVAIGLHPLFTTVRHSCSPNSIIQNERMSSSANGNLWLQPLQVIEVGEEATVAFVDPALPCSLRREILKKQYFIDCECSKCVEEMNNLKMLDPPKVLEMKTIFDTVNALASSASEDTSISGPIQKLRYAVHILIDKSWPLTADPMPMLIQQLISAYMEDLQVNIAMAYAAFAYYRVVVKTTPHPLRVAHTWQLIKLMEAVMEGTHWASQRLDLVPRQLNLEYLIRLFAHKLNLTVKKLPASRITMLIQNRNSYITAVHGGTTAELDDKDKQDAANDGLKQLGRDVQENLRAWRGEIQV